MDWIFRFQLFLFDFDGLLVDTERLHYQAYQRMLQGRGLVLPWNFSAYLQIAHRGAHALKEEIYSAFPLLTEEAPDWNRLYQEKKQALFTLLEQEPVDLMPGAETLLKKLEDADIPRCIVTHSPRHLLELASHHQPILRSIPCWITREDYTSPKPDPECYCLAITRFQAQNQAVIGFEDSYRGLQALLGTHAIPVFICPPETKASLPSLPERVLHASSLEFDFASF